MKLVSVLLLVLLSGGVMAAPDNLNGKKFEQLEQMIKDLEGQMTALTIENALLNDAVSDLERDLGDAEFEITQLENTVAILSAGGGGGDDAEVEYQFVGFIRANNGCPIVSNNYCDTDWIFSICEDTYGTGARITYLNEWAGDKFSKGNAYGVIFTLEDLEHSDSGPFRMVNRGNFQNRNSVKISDTISCSAPI